MAEVAILMMMLSMMILSALNIIISAVLWAELGRLEKSIKKGGKHYE